MRNIYAILSFLMFFSSVYGQDEVTFQLGGFNYTVKSDSTVEISDAGKDVLLPISDDSTLVIPSSVMYDGKTYLVRDIRGFSCHDEIKHLVVSEGVCGVYPWAFFRCLNLESVHFPSTLCIAEGWPCKIFKGCVNLSRITVAEGNDRYDSRENCNAIIVTDSILYMGCKDTRIPSSVTEIGKHAFSYCEKLESMDIPEGVRVIKYSAFENCVNLKKITLPNSLDSIAEYPFRGCASLDSLFIPRNVSRIDGKALAGCHNLKELKVDKRNKTFDSRAGCNAIVNTAQDVIVAGCGSSVIVQGIKGIAPEAFSNSSIRDIRIPKSVRHIAPNAFIACNFCRNVFVDKRNPVYNSGKDNNAIIETASRKLVYGCRMSSIPDDVREIGDYAFFMQITPSYLVIPDGVEVIGERAFSKCPELENIQMPSSLRQIGFSAFGGCEDLCYVDMSRCNANISSYAFSGCKYLYTVNLGSAYEGHVEQSAFWNAPCEAWVHKFLGRNK
ncbi:MAG: leucine-rich repeat domain-containing protein [Paraprevotella sp.]|nr:leucine-rich repeat domain-containing protein [Paraprevotella sp.]